ncbi:MAG TPA: anthranilate phosphoribosyltransferase [Nitrososphaeraceae archaeon]|nr:anthranilate phosphoribosyltransferase [Nitrososphaeraceae archaeon]
MTNEEFNIKNILNQVFSMENLSLNEAKDLFRKIIEGKIENSYVAAILKQISSRGETIDEILAMIQIIKENSITIHPNIKNNLIDICGTGGDKIKTFNISTASAIVAASAGSIIAKHGNRSASGLCGSADFFEFIGLNLNNSPQMVSCNIEKIGIGFLFAPIFHPILKNVSKLRKDINIRTIFNIAAPLCNPCDNLTGQIIGVSDPLLLNKLAKVTEKINKKFFIIHSYDGFDEISNTGSNRIIYSNKGEIKKFDLNPIEVGIPITSLDNISIKNKEESIRLTLGSIYGLARKEIEDIVVLNSAPVLVLSDIAKDIKEGIDISRSVIKEGKARKKLEDLISFYGDKEKLFEVEKLFDII